MSARIAVPRRIASSPRQALALLAGMAIAAFSLRTAMGTVPPLLDDLRDRLGLSSTAAGVLVALPILGLAAGAPLGPWATRRLGDVRGLAGCMLLLTAGCALRALPSAGALFAGTVVASVATGVGGVLVPAIAKRLAPRRAGTLTGVYTLLLICGTSAASGLALPVANAFGGDVAAPLALWSLPALIAGVLLGIQRSSAPAAVAGAPPRAGWIWRDPVAWQVTGFLTLETVLFYGLFSWLPSIAQSHGTAPGTAAAGVALFSFVGIPMSLAVPFAADRRPSQRLVAAGLSAVTVAGLAGLLAASAHPFLLWAVVLGIAQGGAFGLALALLVLRAPDSSSAADLAGMAQTVAYLVGAATALGLGALHDLTGGWTVALIALIAVAGGQLAFGMAAGRDRLVVPPRPDPGGGA